MHNASLQLTQPPKMQTQMLIHKPARHVFEAFVDPAITTKFWFSKGSAPLRPGTTVTWEWETYKVSVEVRVRAIEQNSHIEMEWGDDQKGFTRVEWLFTPHGDATLVTVTEEGYTGTADEVVSKALDSMGGFSYVLAGAKAWLEHGIQLRLVEDHVPHKRSGSAA